MKNKNRIKPCKEDGYLFTKEKECAYPSLLFCIHWVLFYTLSIKKQQWVYIYIYRITQGMVYMWMAFFHMNSTMWLKRNAGLHCQEVGGGNVLWWDGEGKMEKRSFYFQIFPWTQKKNFFLFFLDPRCLLQQNTASPPLLFFFFFSFHTTREAWLLSKAWMCPCVTVTKGNQTWDEDRGRPPGCSYPILRTNADGSPAGLSWKSCVLGCKVQKENLKEVNESKKSLHSWHRSQQYIAHFQ